MAREVLRGREAVTCIRTADVLQQRVPLDGWRRATLPRLCRGAGLRVITTAGERLLLCGRCHARWPFDPRLPLLRQRGPLDYHGPDDRRPGLPRDACLQCDRYLKLLDSQVPGGRCCRFRSGRDAAAGCGVDAEGRT